MSQLSLFDLRNRPKVHVEDCVNYPNMADQSARMDMKSILAKFRAGQPLGISGRTDYIFDQSLSVGDSLDKPLESADHRSRYVEPGDAFVAMKQFDRRISEAKASSKTDIKSVDAKPSEPAGSQLPGGAGSSAA